MTVVTVSRQMGSFGDEASQRAADMLGYQLVYRELIHIAARRAGAPEMALAAIDELGLLKLCPDEETCQAYRSAFEQVMLDFANFGNVIIIGRAAQVILKDHPDTVHLRTIAPMQVRIERICSRGGISPESARSRLLASDRHRRSYLQRFYQVRWDDPQLYDLTINTARMTAQQTANLIAGFVTARHHTPQQPYAEQPPQFNRQFPTLA